MEWGLPLDLHWAVWPVSWGCARQLLGQRWAAWWAHWRCWHSPLVSELLPSCTHLLRVDTHSDPVCCK
jgi:hypothetical protein